MRRTKTQVRPVAALLAATLLLSACGSDTDGDATVDPSSDVAVDEDEPGAEDQAGEADTDAEGAASDEIVMPGNFETGDLVGLGPNGEEPSPISSVEISDEECEEIREAGYTAAISMHYMASDWSRLQVEGIKATLDECGVELVAETDADFDSAQQANDLETIIELGPDVLFSIPTDQAATATAFRRVVDAGVILVLMDNIPDGLSWPEDYASVVAGDSRALGKMAARMLLEATGTDAQIAMIDHGAEFFVTEEREIGAREVFEANGVEVVAAGDILAPEDGLEVAEGMLTANPDIDGFWVVWDTPAMGAITAARTLGRDNVWVTSVDLGIEIAREIASGQYGYGVAAYSPFDSGRAEVLVAFNALLGKETPGYIGTTPMMEITRSNLLEGWRMVQKEEPPEELIELCDGACGS
jgi:ribose transport system substrate-binding protein